MAEKGLLPVPFFINKDKCLSLLKGSAISGIHFGLGFTQICFRAADLPYVADVT